MCTKISNLVALNLFLEIQPLKLKGTSLGNYSQIFLSFSKEEWWLINIHTYPRGTKKLTHLQAWINLHKYLRLLSLSPPPCSPCSPPPTHAHGRAARFSNPRYIWISEKQWITFVVCIWNILIVLTCIFILKDYSLLIWNSNLTSHSVFYLEILYQDHALRPLPSMISFQGTSEILDFDTFLEWF